MEMLDYLAALRDNNRREWYHEHKTQYRQASAQFEALLQELILKIGTFDSWALALEPRELTFKLARDTRFSHDKSPYMPAFRAHIGPAGKLPVPVGYYIMLQPGGSFLGGGVFAGMFKEATRMVRDRICAAPEAWAEVVSAPALRQLVTVQGERLKSVPAGYPKEHPQAEYLKYKSWYLEYPVADEMLRDANVFIERAAEIFAAMKPFNDYLNGALKDFQMPQR